MNNGGGGGGGGGGGSNLSAIHHNDKERERERERERGMNTGAPPQGMFIQDAANNAAMRGNTPLPFSTTGAYVTKLFFLFISIFIYLLVY